MAFAVHTNMMVGFRISEAEAKKELRMRGCRHPLTSPEANYCAACGQPAWEMSERNDIFDGREIGRFQVRQANDKENFYCIGLLLDDFMSAKAMQAIHWDKTRRELEKALGELEIDLSEAAFGLHLIVRHRY